MAGPIYQQNEPGHHPAPTTTELPTLSDIDIQVSPAAMTPDMEITAPLASPIPDQSFVSAPAKLPKRNRVTSSTGPQRPATFDPTLLYKVGARFNSIYDAPTPDEIEGEKTGLDPEELIHAMQCLPSEMDDDHSILTPGLTDATQSGSMPTPNLREDGAYSNLGVPGMARPDERSALGTPFKVEWVHLERLSFHRTQHLRNTWNHNLEVKVSRDGMELNPDVGQKLLREWDVLSTPIFSQVPTANGGYYYTG
jgi:hypothetical protein